MVFRLFKHIGGDYNAPAPIPTHPIIFILISDAFSGDIALSEEEYEEYKYIEEKMNTSIYELQIEDPKAMQGGSGGKYSKYDKYSSGKNPTKSSSQPHKRKDHSTKRKKKRCKRG